MRQFVLMPTFNRNPDCRLKYVAQQRGDVALGVPSLLERMTTKKCPDLATMCSGGIKTAGVL